MVDREALRARADELPDKPGIYFFKSASGEVVYIGKARSLRDRVRSYFLANPDPKVRHILRETADIDYILTGTEREAAFLENNYVRQHQPRFNLRLKDDKSFPYLKISVGQAWPRVSLCRRVEADGSRYFGPFSPAQRARTSLHLVQKLFRVRGCEEAVFRGRKRPCLDHELGLCSAPCVGLVSEADYRESVENAGLFLEGRMPELARTLRKSMEGAAAAERFEEAARLRDLLRTIEDYRDRPRAISTALEDQDVVGLAREGGRAAAFVFFMRKGKIHSSSARLVEAPAEVPDAEVLGGFLDEFYHDRELPPTLLLPLEPAHRAGRPFLSQRTRVLVPRRGQGLKLVDMARRNAEAFLRRRSEEAEPLEALRDALGLPAAPRLIEGFDISNTGGQESVGSLVVFRDGRPDTDSYRRFLVRTVKGPNDVASLEEVLTRRYRKLADAKAVLPDLIMVDGGKPQLGAAEKALAALGLTYVPVVAIAKREEILFTPARRDGIRLERSSPALRLVQAVRDETHRFAISLHRDRREKRSFASLLDGIPGLGPKRKAALLSRYGGLEAIRTAPQAELERLLGPALAANLLELLRGTGPFPKG